MNYSLLLLIAAATCVLGFCSVSVNETTILYDTSNPHYKLVEKEVRLTNIGTDPIKYVEFDIEIFRAANLTAVDGVVILRSTNNPDGKAVRFRAGSNTIAHYNIYAPISSRGINPVIENIIAVC